MKRCWAGILLFLTLTLLFTAALLFGSDRAEGSFNRTLAVTGPVDLEVETGAGRISVRVGASSSVIVNAFIKAHDRNGSRAEDRVRRIESHPPIEQNGNIIHVGHIEDRELRQNISISYELVVPAETRLRASTGSGNQVIEGIRGPVNANTGSGGIKVSDIGSGVRVNTGSGSIELDSVKGVVHAHTGSGSIRAMNVAGEFNGESGSGNITLEQTAPGNVTMHTGSGSVDAKGVHGAIHAHTGSGGIHVEGEPTGEWRLEAGSGEISLQLPPTAAFDLYAHTGSGHVSTAHPITVEGPIRSSEIRGKVRRGGALLDLRTGSGNIRVD